MPDCTLNELPRFSPWPARLLGLEPWEPRRKTPEEIVREFDQEKWGGLLEQVRAAGRPVRVDEVDEWQFPAGQSTVCWTADGLRRVSAAEGHRRQLELVAGVLRDDVPDAAAASALVELGAGYGSVILALARQEPFARMPLVAADYTANGVELLERLAAAQGARLEAGRCDLASARLTELALPANALIFTCFATMYVPALGPGFAQALCRRRPLAVVHFEPCYEHCESDTLLGLMRRRYIEVNDYNTDLLTRLRAERDRGTIQILTERPAVFGANPLLACSVLVWRPQPAAGPATAAGLGEPAPLPAGDAA